VVERLGFEAVRIEGSHYFFRHRDGRALVFTVHPREEIGPVLLRKMLRDAGIAEKDFLDLL